MTDAAAPQDWERRLRGLEDREAIRDLAARYCAAVDAKDAAAVAACFAPDGQLSLPEGPVRGSEALRSFYRERLGAYDLTFHYPHTVVLSDQTPTSATGLVTAHAEHGIDGVCYLAALTYSDRYVKDGDAWLLRARSVGFLYFLPMRDFDGTFERGARFGRPAPGD